MLRQTINVMKKLREFNRSLDNNQKINDWVDLFLDENKLKNKSITIISPWSLSKAFEKRYGDQGNTFLPTQGEIKLFEKEIPKIISIFKENGFEVDWWIAFSRSYIDERVINIEMEKSYISMIQNIVEIYNSPVVLINWEDDVTQKRHTPNQKIITEDYFDTVVSNETLSLELKRWSEWVDEANIVITADELLAQTKYQIACEAEEGRYLMEEKNSLCEPGNFIFLPMGRPERYTYFSLVAKEFEKRMVFILSRYPWRNYEKKKFSPPESNGKPQQQDTSNWHRAW